MKKTEKKNRPVMVLDANRGIYYGTLVEKLAGENTVRLENARHCFYYSEPKKAGEKGTYSLATIGPQSGSRVGPRVSMTVFDVSKIVSLTDEAIAAWEASTWE